MPTLVDGREVDSASPEWQRECLARYVLAMPIAARRAWLAEFDAKNAQAGKALREVVAAIHAARKRQR